MMEAAERSGAIIVPGVGALYSTKRYFNHFARLEFKDNRLHSSWVRSRPQESLSPCMSFVAPGWVISRENFDRIGGWSVNAGGWGSTEVNIALRASFCGIPILSMREALTFHRFRNTAPYHISWHDIWNNAYAIARICFGEKGFYEYIYPIYTKAYWNDKIDTLLKNPSLIAEADAFQSLKRRSSEEILNLIDNAPKNTAKIIEDKLNN